MIILVEFFCQLICIIGYYCRRMCISGLGYLHREKVEELDDPDFLGRKGCVRMDILLAACLYSR